MSRAPRRAGIGRLRGGPVAAPARAVFCTSRLPIRGAASKLERERPRERVARDMAFGAPAAPDPPHSPPGAHPVCTVLRCGDVGSPGPSHPPFVHTGLKEGNL